MDEVLTPLILPWERMVCRPEAITSGAAFNRKMRVDNCARMGVVTDRYGQRPALVVERRIHFLPNLSTLRN